MVGESPGEPSRGRSHALSQNSLTDSYMRTSQRKVRNSVPLGPPCFSRCVPHSQLLGRRGHCLFGRSSWPGGWLRLRDAAGSLGRNRVTIRVGSDPGSAARGGIGRSGTVERSTTACSVDHVVTAAGCRGCTACSGISRSVSQCSRNVRSRALILFIMQAWCSRS